MPEVILSPRERRSRSRLASVGVEIIDAARLWLRCGVCGQKWSPNTPAGGGRLYRGYWKCPNGCNHAD